MNCAPIALFVYNRPDHTRRTVESLRQNRLAGDSDLIVFSDAARSDAHTEKVREVREYIRTISGFKSLTIIEREINFGLARSIIEGVTEIVGKYGRVIVLEDDLITSPHFLGYMNDALTRYANDERVVCIHGYMFPIERQLPEAFFLPGADCWGWATWSRGWACFNSDGQALLDELKRRNLTDAFDYHGAYPFSKMLEGQIKGENDSWAVRWHASAFLGGKLTLHPGRSLVRNIGTDSSGTHCGDSADLDVGLSGTPINLERVAVEPSQIGLQAFEEFFRKIRPGGLRRVLRKAKTLLMLAGK